jgi:tetratricopeptide (TPR) repeat protein
MRKAIICLLVIAALWFIPAWQSTAGASSPDRERAEAQALIQAGHWKRARALLDAEIKDHPDDARDCYLLAKVKMAFKDLDGALALAQRAVDLDGKNSDFHLELGQIYGKMAAQASLFSAGVLALKFRRQVEIALELDPQNLDALDALMQFKFQAPAAMGGSKDEAQTLAEKIALLNPSEGYLARAELAEMGKNPTQAEAYLLKAVQADPKNYDALTTLAKFYVQAPHIHYDEATKYARSALQLDPKQIEAYWILARVFALQERWSELDQTLRDSEKNVPDDLRPFYEAAQALSETGKDLPRAEGYAKKYLSQAPEGDEPGDAQARRLLGLLFEKQGRNAEARLEFYTALQIQPNFKAAKKDLKWLQN